MRVNLNGILNRNYQEMFQYSGEELLVWGGAGAGKSYSIADKFLMQSILQPGVPIKALIIRKTFPSLRNTCIDILDRRAKAMSLPFNLNQSSWTAQCKDMKFIFTSLNNQEDYGKLQSITDVDFIWLNEVRQLREEDYDECLRRLRGGQSAFQQIVSDFNPVGRHSWVYKRFFEKNVGNVKKLWYNVFSNHPDYLKTEKAQLYIKRLQARKEHDINQYRIYFEGQWGEVEGVIYNWDVVPFPHGVNFDEVFYGGDFGFSIDPAVLVEIFRKADEFWVRQVIYKTDLTNKYLAAEIKRSPIVQERPQYWDSGEPKSITELCQYGVPALPCVKGKDSVRHGIDMLRALKIHIIEGSDDIMAEREGYVMKKDRENKPTGEPIDWGNHAMDAIRYAITTHCAWLMAAKNQKDNVHIIECKSVADRY
jgi:phage terminase large subunit